MAMFIEYTENNNGGKVIKAIREWHVGESLPFMVHEYKVISIQADGDELEYLCKILGCYSNTPTKHFKTVVKWEDARARILWHLIWADKFTPAKENLAELLWM